MIVMNVSDSSGHNKYTYSHICMFSLTYVHVVSSIQSCFYVKPAIRWPINIINCLPSMHIFYFKDLPEYGSGLPERNSETYLEGP